MIGMCKGMVSSLQVEKLVYALKRDGESAVLLATHGQLPTVDSIRADCRTAIERAMMSFECLQHPSDRLIFKGVY